jgi:hypothetical protein
MIEIIIQLCPEIMVCGWWSKDEDVVWYAIWRDRHQEKLIDTYLNRAVCSRVDLVDPFAEKDLGKQLAMPRYLIKPLGEGELFALEAEQAVRPPCTMDLLEHSVANGWTLVSRSHRRTSGMSPPMRWHCTLT